MCYNNLINKDDSQPQLRRNGEKMKSILITGAAGGMGRATAALLAERGYRVFSLDRKETESTDGIISVIADVTDPESVREAYEKISDMTESLYAVIHFAGIYLLDSLIEVSEEEFNRAFRINLGGAYLINKVFLPLIERGGRILITTSELANLDPLPFTGIYAVTKAALDKYAYSLAMELQLLDISVSVLRAGAVTTDMLGVSTDALDRFCKETELYSCNARRFKDIVNRVEARSVRAEKIALRAAKIIGSPRPRFAYSVNRNPLLVLLSILPKRLQLRIIKWILS